MAVSPEKPQKPLNIVLITTGIRPVAKAFADFPEAPIGIIMWDSLPIVPATAFWRPALRWLWAKARGRSYASLKHLCTKNQLRYAEVDKADAPGLASLLGDWECDLVVTSGCSMIPMSALSNVPLGGINLHPSLLPNHRGANPFFWQIADDVQNLGVTVHRLSARADAGDILGSRACRRPDGLDKEALTQLTEADMGVPLLKDCIDRLCSDPDYGEPQHAVSPTPYAHALSESELVERFPLHTLNARCAYNMMCFLRHCPNDWLSLNNWRSRFAWKATALLSTDSSDESKTEWHIANGLFGLKLIHSSGNIQLRIKGLRKNR